MARKHLALLAISAAALAVQPASAAITWTDWTSAGTNTVSGTAGPVTVTYSGAYSFAQLTPSTDWYTGAAFPPAYKPSNTDIIGLSQGGAKSITFSTAVTDVYLAIVSWNGQVATFDHPITIVTQGCGWWGCGTATLSNSDYTLTGSGELHGVLQFAEPLTSLSFTDVSENWHGVTVGYGAIAAIPEPASWVMMIAGFGLAGAAMRSRRRTVVRIA